MEIEQTHSLEEQIHVVITNLLKLRHPNKDYDHAFTLEKDSTAKNIVRNIRSLGITTNDVSDQYIELMIGVEIQKLNNEDFANTRRDIEVE